MTVNKIDIFKPTALLFQLNKMYDLRKNIY